MKPKQMNYNSKMSLTVRGIDLVKRGLGSMKKKKRSDANDANDFDASADITI